VFFLCFTIDQDVVEIRGTELVEIFTESIVNKSLERSRSSY
jgi:hypothetical protein